MVMLGGGGSDNSYGTDTYDRDYGGPTYSEGEGGYNPGFDVGSGVNALRNTQWQNFKNISNPAASALFGGVLGKIGAAVGIGKRINSGESLTKSVDAELSAMGYSSSQIDTIKKTAAQEITQAESSANLRGDYNPTFTGGGSAGSGGATGLGDFGAGGASGDGSDGGLASGGAISGGGTDLDKMWADYSEWLEGPGTFNVKLPGFMGGGIAPLTRTKAAQARVAGLKERTALPIDLEKLRLEEKRIDTGSADSRYNTDEGNEKDYFGAAAVALPSILEEVKGWF